MQELKIGSVTLKSNILMAPMAGVSDLPFRLLCREQGAALVCTEMVSAKAILYNNKNTDQLMEIHPDEGSVSLQLFGSDPEIISEMARRIEERPFSVLDINMGCPVPKVVNNGEGSALMKTPLLAGKIIEKTVRAIRKPVTVKIRNQRTILCGNGGLGYYCPGQAGGQDTGSWERRCNRRKIRKKNV